MGRTSSVRSRDPYGAEIACGSRRLRGLFITSPQIHPLTVRVGETEGDERIPDSPLRCTRWVIFQAGPYGYAPNAGNGCGRSGTWPSTSPRPPTSALVSAFPNESPWFA